jgi:hypothetical protein
MSWTNDLQQFTYATDDLGAAGDNTAIFFASTRVQIVEVGIHITVDLVPGAADVTVCEFDITSASVGVTASETTAPTRAAAETELVSPTTNVTVQDGKVLSRKVDFTMQKGETLICQMSGTPTSGTGFPYIIYRMAGSTPKEVADQRSATAVE